jgi:hypothetical protein
MKGLQKLDSLRYAPTLEEFIYVLAENQTPEKMLPILQNSSVRRMLCRFGSTKKNLQFDELLKEHKKEEYTASLSEFKFSA